MDCAQEHEPLLSFLHKVHNCGRKAQWWFAQLIRHLGCMLEMSLLPTGQQAAPDAGDRRAEGDGAQSAEAMVSSSRLKHEALRRRMRFAASMRVRIADPQGVNLNVVKYFFCMRRHFQKPDHLSIAVDASRVGKKNYLSVSPPCQGACLARCLRRR